MNCPMCEERGEPSPDTHKKLWVNMDSGKFHCYRCKWSGSLARLVSKLSKVPFEQALKLLRGALLDPFDHISLNLYEEKYDLTDDEDQIRRARASLRLSTHRRPSLISQGAWRALAVRCRARLGVLQMWALPKIALSSRPSWILVWFSGKQGPHGITLITRSLRRFFNPSGVSARQILYNYDVAAEYPEIVIVEGFMDALKVGPNAVATNGKRLILSKLSGSERPALKASF